MAGSQKTSVPYVPLRTPMFGDHPDRSKWAWNLTQEWYIFFERLGRKDDEQIIRQIGQGGPYIRTLLLKDSTVGDNIADFIPIFIAGKAMRVIGVLRKVIASDLTVRINHVTATTSTALVTITIPTATAIATPVEETAFVVGHLDDELVLSFDVTASDGQKDAAGVASFTLEWQ